MATVGIFLPIYLGVVVPGRWFTRHRDHPQIRAFVKGATAAAAGAIARATVVLGRQAIVDFPTILIALASLAYLIRIKGRFKEPLLLGAAAVGLLIRGV